MSLCRLYAEHKPITNGVKEVIKPLHAPSFLSKLEIALMYGIYRAHVEILTSGPETPETPETQNPTLSFQSISEVMVSDVTGAFYTAHKPINLIIIQIKVRQFTSPARKTSRRSSRCCKELLLFLWIPEKSPYRQ